MEKIVIEATIGSSHWMN